MLLLRSRTASVRLCFLLALAAGFLLAQPAAHASSPLPAPACSVPQVINQQLAYAKHVIVQAHCRVGKVRRAHSAVHLKGRVLAQNPGVGRLLKNGARVSLVVGRGPRHH